MFHRTYDLGDPPGPDGRCLMAGHFTSDQPEFASIICSWPGKGTPTLSPYFLVYKIHFHLTHRALKNRREVTKC